jgi:hypothetical protein
LAKAIAGARGRRQRRVLALACPTLYLFFVGGEPQRNKLFHAIVGLGLAAAGCGGKDQAPIADAGPHDANADASMPPDASTESEPQPDAATSIDATAAADVAVDVAEEIWHPIVIQ